MGQVRERKVPTSFYYCPACDGKHDGEPVMQSRILPEDLPEEGITPDAFSAYSRTVETCREGWVIDPDDTEQYHEGETAFQCASCETWWLDRDEAADCCWEEDDDDEAA